MIQNIFKNPSEPKFRKISSENENLKKKVLNIEKIETLLNAIGFVEENKHFQFSKEHEIYLQTTLNGLMDGFSFFFCFLFLDI